MPTKQMRLRGFKQAVKKLAKGQYHSVRHEITETHAGNILYEWSAYIAGVGWTMDLSTPEAVLRALEKKCSTSK